MKRFFLLFTAVLMLAHLVACEFYTREEQLAMLRLNDDDFSHPSDLSVKQIIDAMQRANDPKKQFMNADRYILKQKAISEKQVENRRTSQEYVTEIKFCEPDMIRWTHIRNNKPFQINICRGGSVWSVDPHSLKSKKLNEGLELNMFRTMIGLMNPQKTYLDVFKSVSVDKVFEEEKTCYRLICQAHDDEIPPYVVYVDAKTFLTLKVETIKYLGDGSQSMYISVPQEYTWYGDVLMPRVTSVSTSQGTDFSFITEFVINPNIPASDFELPKRFEINLNGEPTLK